MDPLMDAEIQQRLELIKAEQVQDELRKAKLSGEGVFDMTT